MSATAREGSAGCWNAPLWSSGFRPFYLVGCGYGLIALGFWAAAHFGATNGIARLLGDPSWHAHEMIFGFVTAMCGGFILTALPSWAGIAAITGRRLALLVSVWAIGRLGIVVPVFPATTAALDLAFVPLLTAMVAPQVWSARNRLYRLLLPILALLAGGNALFHFGVVTALPETAHLGIRMGLYALMLLFSFVGGLLTPVFTAALVGGNSAVTRFCRPIEILAPASLIVLALADLGGLGPDATAMAALAAAIIHAVRMASWRGSGILAQPLVAAMHAGYACFVAALAIQAASVFGSGFAASAATHAFTVGAMGLTKLSLMTRVALKHTGRPLKVPPLMAAGFVFLGLAALGRVIAAVLPQAGILLVISAMSWISTIGIYLWLYGTYLVRPSLPRRGDAA